jgi:hypothetical protein
MNLVKFGPFVNREKSKIDMGCRGKIRENSQSVFISQNP